MHALKSLESQIGVSLVFGNIDGSAIVKSNDVVTTVGLTVVVASVDRFVQSMVCLARNLFDAFDCVDRGVLIVARASRHDDISSVEVSNKLVSACPYIEPVLVVKLLRHGNLIVLVRPSAH